MLIEGIICFIFLLFLYYCEEVIMEYQNVYSNYSLEHSSVFEHYFIYIKQKKPNLLRFCTVIIYSRRNCTMDFIIYFKYWRTRVF